MSFSVSNSVKIIGITSTIPEVSGKRYFQHISHINVRRSPDEQTASDLAFDAASRILIAKDIDLTEVGVLVFVSRTPDYRSPTTAAVLQGRLGISVDCICYDVNRGSSGFAAGVQLVSSILINLNKKYGMVLLGDTPSKFDPTDTYFSAIESDAASAVLLEKSAADQNISSFYKSFGSNFKDFSILKGGFRYYNPSEKFDSTLKSNFEVTFNEDAIKDILSTELNTFLSDIKSVNLKTQHEFYHSQLALLVHDAFQHLTDQTNVSVLREYGNTYGSNLPLQLADFVGFEKLTDKIAVSCNSFGEGLELCYLHFELDPFVILETTISNNHFEDYRVSHEM
jgi:3-oxoacyl-[acyl-carrier-protein] synthase-3